MIAKVFLIISFKITYLRYFKRKLLGCYVIGPFCWDEGVGGEETCRGAPACSKEWSWRIKTAVNPITFLSQETNQKQTETNTQTKKLTNSCRFMSPVSCLVLESVNWVYYLCEKFLLSFRITCFISAFAEGILCAIHDYPCFNSHPSSDHQGLAFSSVSQKSKSHRSC